MIALISLVLAIFRRYAPRPTSRFETWTLDKSQVPERLPTGAIGGVMWSIGLCLALSYFLLRFANHALASSHQHVLLNIYPTDAWWCFFPLFSALTVPWPLTIWLLQRAGRTDEVDAAMEISDEQQNLNSFLVMKWLAILLVAPIGVFTLLALPVHLSIDDKDARLGHYGRVSDEVFHLKDATSATLVDGVRDRDGSLHLQKDLVINFPGGRQLRANAVGDGGTSADPRVIELLLKLTGLTAKHRAEANQVPSVN